MIDVLSDLEAFADRNGLPVLAQKIAETASIAAAEIGNDPAVTTSTAALSHLGVVMGMKGHDVRIDGLSRAGGGRTGA